MKDRKNLIVWGATGQLLVLEEFLNNKFKIRGLIDRNTEVISPFKDTPIFHNETDFLNFYSNFKEDLFYIVAIGGNSGKDRIEIGDFFLKHKLRPISAIHDTAIIAKNAKLGQSLQVMMGVCIAAKCNIGSDVIINTSASVDHECIIKEGVHIAPGAKLAGKVTVGKYSFIGTGAIILPNIKIGKRCVIGAGSVVTRDIPDYTKAYGNPAKNKGETNE